MCHPHRETRWYRKQYADASGGLKSLVAVEVRANGRPLFINAYANKSPGRARAAALQTNAVLRLQTFSRGWKYRRGFNSTSDPDTKPNVVLLVKTFETRLLGLDRDIFTTKTTTRAYEYCVAPEVLEKYYKPITEVEMWLNPDVGLIKEGETVTGWTQQPRKDEAL